MSGLAGNVAWLALGKQPAKGTAATTPSVWTPMSSTARPAPSREMDRLSETDADRDPGATYLKSTSVGGGAQVYGRDSVLDLIFGGVLGTVVDSGTTPNYIHTATTAIALPYFTVWTMVGNTLFEKLTDVQIGEATVRAGAGEPMTVDLTFMGLQAVRLTADPSAAWTPLVLDSDPVYTYNEAVVTLGGSASQLLSSFELSISNNLSLQQTNGLVPLDMAAGRMEVGLSFDMIFQDLTKYNNFYYGSASGTAPATTIFSEAMDFTFSKGTNNSVDLSLPKVTYEEFPVEVQPDGSPITVSVRANVDRNAGSLLTATVKNQKATAF